VVRREGGREGGKSRSCFSLLSHHLSSPSLPPRGITLVSLSVVCDAILPNLQVRLFEAGSSRLEGKAGRDGGREGRRGGGKEGNILH